MRTKSLILPILLLFVSGCATIIHGRSQDVMFVSQPQGATVKIDGAVKGVTPTKIALKRNQDYIVTIEKDGFEPVERTLKSELSGWTFGNILLGGIVGGVIDLAAGGAWKLSEDKIEVGLKPVGGYELQQGAQPGGPQ